MTTIITDGKSMAADKQAEYDNHHIPVVKIHRVGEEIIGISGCHAFGNRVIEWYKGDADIKDFPPNASNNWQVLVLSKDGVKNLFEHGFVNIPLDFVAIGCGRDFALSAAYLGKTLKEAIEFASVHDIDTGMGVDILHLKKEKDGAIKKRKK